MAKTRFSLERWNELNLLTFSYRNEFATRSSTLQQFIIEQYQFRKFKPSRCYGRYYVRASVNQANMVHADIVHWARGARRGADGATSRWISVRPAGRHTERAVPQGTQVHGTSVASLGCMGIQCGSICMRRLPLCRVQSVPTRVSSAKTT